MYEVCMSADSRIEPNFRQDSIEWTDKPPVSLGPECLVYEEDTGSNIGGLLIKSGFLVLFAVTMFGGYQFLKTSNSGQQLANLKPSHDWSGRPIKTDGNQELVALGDQTSKIRKIDLTTTSSVKKTKKATDKLNPINHSTSTNTKFHIVQPGDTLSAIGRKFKISAAEIMEINTIDNPRRIKPGMKLFVSR